VRMRSSFAAVGSLVNRSVKLMLPSSSVTQP
jgi:hypothetical protein